MTVKVGNAQTTYGTAFDKSKYTYSYLTLVNGDTAEVLNADLKRSPNYTNTGDGTGGRATQDVGEYSLTINPSAFNSYLKNYKVKEVTPGTSTINRAPYTISVNDIRDITYGEYKTLWTALNKNAVGTISGLTNGDEKRFDSTFTGTSEALLFDGKKWSTNNVNTDGYAINPVIAPELRAALAKNYRLVSENSGRVYLDKAKLQVNIGNAETVYGTKFNEGLYSYAYSKETGKKLVNGDTKDSLATGLGTIKYYNDAALDGKTTDRWTKDVGNNYLLTFTDETKGAFNALNNYNVSFVAGKAKVTPYTLTEENIVNPDGKPLYTTKYGQKDKFGTATFTGVNGDGTLLLDITDSSALTGAADGRITKDAGDNIYDTTVSLENLKNKNYQFEKGKSSKTFENTASVTKAKLIITTDNVKTKYGTVKKATSTVKGLTNGDENNIPETGFIFDYGDYNNYGGAYLENNTKTNSIGTYNPFKTKFRPSLNPEYLSNYTVESNEARVTIDPKDVTFFVTGTGNSLADVTYTVTPDIDAQLAYGEHVDVDYTPDNAVGENQYGVVAHINGTPIISGNVAGNYQYNYEGLITITPPDPTVPTKPDINPHNPSNVNGSGSWTSNMGNRGIPGVERVAGLASAELPFFKVEAGQVSHYGTYDVAADPDKVRLEPTGKRLPEPNQPKTQYREYTKALTTTDGTGMFRMVYDGSTFNITPVDDGALALMRMGDVKNNVELSAEALHAGFSEMGILLEDLDGVYVHFDTMA